MLGHWKWHGSIHYIYSFLFAFQRLSFPCKPFPRYIEHWSKFAKFRPTYPISTWKLDFQLGPCRTTPLQFHQGLWHAKPSRPQSPCRHRCNFRGSVGRVLTPHFLKWGDGPPNFRSLSSQKFCLQNE